METRPLIFNATHRKKQTEQIARISGDEYCELFKIPLYIQDAVKIILDKREDKPHEVLSEYFSIALKGEHVLLRDFSFVCASQFNRASYLRQIEKIFLASPYYRVITALDYHQCLCLVCSDFPRTLVADTSKVLTRTEYSAQNPATTFTSTLSAESILFDKFEISDLQEGVDLFFYYSEYMEKVKELFSELTNASFECDSEIMISLLFTGLSSIMNRNRFSCFNFPPMEAIIESILKKAQKKLKLNCDAFYLLEEIGSLIHGSGCISYREFCCNLMKNPTLKASIFSCLEVPESHEEELRLLAVEDTVFPEDIIQAPKRNKANSKKKKSSA